MFIIIALKNLWDACGFILLVVDDVACKAKSKSIEVVLLVMLDRYSLLGLEKESKRTTLLGNTERTQPEPMKPHCLLTIYSYSLEVLTLTMMTTRLAARGLLIASIIVATAAVNSPPSAAAFTTTTTSSSANR